MIAALDASVTFTMTLREAEVIRGYLGMSTPSEAAKIINGSRAFNPRWTEDTLSPVSFDEFGRVAMEFSGALATAKKEDD